MVELVDIGANLTHDSFDADRDEVIGRAAECGVTRLIVTGSTVEASEQAADLADARPGVLFATAGVHPHHASDWSDDAARSLRSLCDRAPVVAVGECGLDYFRNFSPRDAQRTAFRAQLELAAECRLPVFLHQRDAHDDFLGILEPMMGGLAGGVAHCFTGDARVLREYLDLGLYIGITGWICDERRGLALRQAAAEIPLDRLMIETDAPYLLPRTLKPRPRTRRNEPMYLREVLRVVASCLSEPEEVVAEAATRNSKNLFRLQA
ncbi:MAG TPA: TatD family hydrolase [Woeseiaceae bacterium]|nr:TatD family hydrolase [Woeseiaceae bacterium]